MRKFWNFDDNGDERILRLEGAIAEESWFGDEITPAAFKSELTAGTGDITVWINSPGGCCFSGAEIYTALKDYPGKVTVKISAVAASAASVIAMAGDEVLMSPVACMVIHNPMTVAIGDGEEMLRAKDMLDNVKQTIINAYTFKSGLSRDKLSQMMDAESWIFAQDAIELRLADGMLYDDERTVLPTNMIFSRQAVTASLLRKLPRRADDYYNRLNKLKY
ncbi:Clp protease ClpP [Eubacteriales bacterium OttesenSCG-928-G02]|nr:Clp protease ClpP [Eubacteriales bacterium OttesenSCG-928-G02]